MSLNHSEARIEEIIRMLKVAKNGGGRVALLGALGAGMSCIGGLLLHEGVSLLGQDIRGGGDGCGYPVYKQLSEKDFEGVVLCAYSLAIDKDDESYLAARRLGILTVSRAELLGAICADYENVICVAGTHGKSTTSAMLAHILKYVGRTPTSLLGAVPIGGSALTVSDKRMLLLEACEYKDSFLQLTPDLCVLGALALDHTDYFASFDQYLSSFKRFCASAETVVYNLESEGSVSASLECNGRRISYGTGERCDFRYRIGGKSLDGMEYTLYYDNNCLHSYLPMIGEYNLKNLCGAIGAASALGVSVKDAAEALTSFLGVERRMQRLYGLCSVPLIYDYAHHPEELLLAISELKALTDSLTVVFMPHTYSRTKSFFDEFARALSLADQCILLDIYPAREEPIKGVSSEALACAVGGGCLATDEARCARLLRSVDRGAIALLGAGDMDRLFRELKSFR